MGAIASQITSLTIVYSIVCSDADQRKHQSSASLAFVRGIHRGPVNSPHKWPVTRKMFPFDEVIMDMEMLSALFALCEGNPPVTDWLSRPVIRNFDDFLVVYSNWIEMTWSSGDVTLLKNSKRIFRKEIVDKMHVSLMVGPQGVICKRRHKFR